MNRPRIVLIVDELRLRRWQAEALQQLADSAEFSLLNCTNTKFIRRPFRHALYYILNIISLRNPANKTVPLPQRIKIIERLDFEAEWDGAWQRFPISVLNWLAEWQPQLAIKFGMGLLRMPEALECKILSYHHGDPRQYRGRPGGFYEMLHGVPVVGQIVQIISNRLDAGNIVAFAETRVQPHSYQATMADAYRLSPLLMKTAVQNALSGKTLPMEPDGRNYRLPSNWLVARLAVKLIVAKVRRLLYGIFFEKDWVVAQTDMAPKNSNDLFSALLETSSWQIVRRPNNYRFLADPFPHPKGGLLVEALRRSDGQGEIVHVGADFAHVLCQGKGHFSYPGTICIGQDSFLVPEVAEWSSPRVFRLTERASEFVGILEVEKNPRLVDPTLYAHECTTYLFANELTEGSQVLRLWIATDLRSKFIEHRSSPIRISPEGSRMAGAILRMGDRLFRLGQECSRGYGNGVVLFEVLKLSPTSYEETRLEKLVFAGVNGPHTLNFRGSVAVFDFYHERFTPLAGIRRLRAALSKQRANAAQPRVSLLGSAERRPQATQ